MIYVLLLMLLLFYVDVTDIWFSLNSQDIILIHFKNIMENPKLTPINNGAIYEEYLWTQTPQSIQIFVYLIAPCTKKDIKLKFTHTKLSVIVNGLAIIDGDLQYAIDDNQSIWFLESGKVEGYEGKYLHIILEKHRGNLQKWWSTPIKGHKEIDTSLIVEKFETGNQSTNNILPPLKYFEEDKILKNRFMVMQNQVEKQAKLKAFMDAHPEMDFSKCKF